MLFLNLSSISTRTHSPFAAGYISTTGRPSCLHSSLQGARSNVINKIKPQDSANGGNIFTLITSKGLVTTLPTIEAPSPATILVCRELWLSCRWPIPAA